uniref:Ig-like domain-containing protein n=1 Tax=Electrophorus electricus TaxID=8005 RepID=A0A4W4E3Z7_ELEEL
QKIYPAAGSAVLLLESFMLCVSAGCMLVGNRRTDNITAYTGDSVLLPCSCTDPHKYNPNRNTWDVISSESEQYRNRVQLNTAHSPGNLSLLISHLTEEDEGDYRCQTKGNKHKDIKLYVSESINLHQFCNKRMLNISQMDLFCLHMMGHR